MKWPDAKLSIKLVLGVFTLLNEKDEVLASGLNPGKLSAFGFAEGAQAVKHDYDLKLADFTPAKAKRA